MGKNRVRLASKAYGMPRPMMKGGRTISSSTAKPKSVILQAVQARMFNPYLMGQQRQQLSNKQTAALRRQDRSMMKQLQLLNTAFNGGKPNVYLKMLDYWDTPSTSMTEKKIDAVRTKKRYDIHIPKYSVFTTIMKKVSKYSGGSSLDEPTAFRLFRFTDFHENQHVRSSPDQEFRGPPATGLGETGSNLYNILDDRRIEEIGIKEVVSMAPERLYDHAWNYTQRPKLDSLTKRYADVNVMRSDKTVQHWIDGLAANKYTHLPDSQREMMSRDPANREAIFQANLPKIRKAIRKEAVIEAIVQQILLDNQNGTLEPTDEAKFQTVMADTKKEIAQNLETETDLNKVNTGMIALIKKIMKDLDIEEDDKDFQTQIQDPHERQPTIDPDELIKFLKSLKAAKAHREDGDPAGIITQDDIDEAVKGEKAQQDFQDCKGNAEKQVQREKAEEDPASPEDFVEPLDTGDPSDYRDSTFINKMLERLRDWRLRRKRIYGESGSEIDIDRFASKSEQPFMSRLRLDAANRKTLFILDFSGSQSRRSEIIKKVLESTMEVLSDIHVPTAMYGFNGELFKVKDFRQPWNQGKAELLAGLETGGGTPLGPTLEALEPYIKKYSPRHTIILTDGAPDNDAPVIKAANVLRRSTNVVAFGIDDTKQSAEAMARKLKSLGFKNSFAVSDIYDVPRQLIPLIAPNK